MKTKSGLVVFLFASFGSLTLAAPFTGALLEAQGDLYRKEYKKAEDQFRLNLNRSDLRREATLGLASALQGQGKGEEAVELLSEHLLRSPMDVPALIQLADLRIEMGQAELARQELGKVKVLRPSQEGLDERFAQVSAMLGQKEEAAETLEGLRGKGRLGFPGLFLLARLKFELGQFAVAESLIHDIESQFSSNASIYLLKAKVLGSLKRMPEAEVAYRRAIQAEQRDPAAWNAYAEFLQGEKRHAEARKILESAAPLNPSDPASQIRLGEAHELAEDYSAATKSFAKALALAPGSDQAMFGLVRVEEKSGAMDQVGMRLQSWLGTYPEKTWVAISYARLLSAIGQRARAAEVISGALKTSPGAKELTAYLAELKNAPLEIEPQPASVKAAPAAEGRRASAESGDEYVVQKGELLGTISTKVYGTSKHWRKIFEANRDRLKGSEELTPGLKLRLPKIKGSKPAAPSPGTGKASPRARDRTYVVKAGEILSRISEKMYGTSKEWMRIYQANRKKLRRPTSVFAGMRLKIPALEPVSVPVAAEVAEPAPAAAMVVEESFSFMSAAPARKSESLLVSPDSVKLPDLGTPPPAMEPEDSEAALPAPPRVDGGLHFSLGAAAARESIELAASGFSASLPAKLGYQGMAELGYRLEARPVDFAARFHYSSTRFDGLTGVTPTSIKVERKRLGLFARFPSGFGGLGLRLGYSFSFRSVAETSPRAFVTNREASGLLAGAALAYGMGDRWQGATDLEFFLPHKVVETGALTGFHRNGWAAELGTEVSHNLSSSATLALGLRARVEQHTFTGAGSRGSIDAKDSDFIVTVPLEARF